MKQIIDFMPTSYSVIFFASAPGGRLVTGHGCSVCQTTAERKRSQRSFLKQVYSAYTPPSLCSVCETYFLVTYESATGACWVAAGISEDCAISTFPLYIVWSCRGSLLHLKIGSYFADCSEPPHVDRRAQLDHVEGLGRLPGIFCVFKSETKMRRGSLNVISVEEVEAARFASHAGKGFF